MSGSDKALELMLNISVLKGPEGKSVLLPCLQVGK